MRTRKNQSKLGLYASYAVLTIICIIFLAPFFFMIVSSFKSGQELIRKGLTFQIDFNVMSLDNYKLLFFEDNRYVNWYRSSLIITALHTVLALVFSSLVGYGLAVYNFKGKRLIFFIVLLVMMIPLEILLLPLYRLITEFGLINKYLGVVLPFAVSPFAVFFFRQYIIGLPKELIEAARVDGCNEFIIFIRIIAPLMKPAFGAMFILQALWSWNSFVWPLIVLRTTERLTIPIGLMSLITPYGHNYDMLMPGAVMSVLPVAIIFLINQRAFIRGMSAGGIKG